MKVTGVELDQDAENFLDEIADELVALFGVTREDALERVRKAVAAHRPSRELPGPQPITGDHLIYHCSPEHWAKAIWHGRRNSGTKCDCKHLLKKWHDASGCHASYSAGPSGTFRCPCRVAYVKPVKTQARR